MVLILKIKYIQIQYIKKTFFFQSKTTYHSQAIEKTIVVHYFVKDQSIISHLYFLYKKRSEIHIFI